MQKIATDCLPAMLADIVAYIVFSAMMFPLLRWLAGLLGLSTASTGTLILFSLAAAFVLVVIIHSLFVMYGRGRGR